VGAWLNIGKMRLDNGGITSVIDVFAPLLSNAPGVDQNFLSTQRVLGSIVPEGAPGLRLDRTTRVQTVSVGRVEEGSTRLDMSRFGFRSKKENDENEQDITCQNIVLLWRRNLAECSSLTRRFITKMEIKQTTRSEIWNFGFQGTPRQECESKMFALAVMARD